MLNVFIAVEVMKCTQCNGVVPLLLSSAGRLLFMKKMKREKGVYL